MVLLCCLSYEIPLLSVFFFFVLFLWVLWFVVYFLFLSYLNYGTDFVLFSCNELVWIVDFLLNNFDILVADLWVVCVKDKIFPICIFFLFLLVLGFELLGGFFCFGYLSLWYSWVIIGGGLLFVGICGFFYGYFFCCLGCFMVTAVWLVTNWVLVCFALCYWFLCYYCF